MKTKKKAIVRGSQARGINDFNASAESSYHIMVEVEFNGKNPGGTYYDRLHAMDIWVNRGNREEFPSALNRRMNAGTHPQALVVQEGMFACENEDVARRIANLADECGAEHVSIGRYYSTVYRVNEKDLVAYENYKKGTSKRGPKNQKEVGKYTVTCFQEARSFETELDAFPFACPSCGSNHFTVHFGAGKRYVKPDWSQESSVYDYWLRSRFGQGVYEIPLHGAGTSKKLPPLTVKDPPDMPKLNVSQQFNLSMQDPDFALHVWDVAYSLNHFTNEERFSERLNVINVYIYQGGTSILYMGVPEDGFDMVDLCILDKDLMRFL